MNYYPTDDARPSNFPRRVMSPLQDVIVRAVLSVFAVAFGLALVAMINGGCSSDPTTKRVEAAGGYQAQQDDCIANNKGREAIDRCRDAVKADWAKRDAGAP